MQRTQDNAAKDDSAEDVLAYIPRVTVSTAHGEHGLDVAFECIAALQPKATDIFAITVINFSINITATALHHHHPSLHDITITTHACVADGVADFPVDGHDPQTRWCPILCGCKS